MQGLSEAQLLGALVALGVILIFARAAGELARRMGQPEVLGEFVAGFALGPSVLGALLPGVHRWLFLQPQTGLALSAMSWMGAILLLLIAGIEVDLAILRKEAKPGTFAAALAILPSIAAGTLFSLLVLRRPLAFAFFLGIVLSTTAVSVAAKIMIEREILRRRYAQVILAGGIASEVLVWLMVSVVSAAHERSPLVAVRSAVFAVAFFVFMMLLGRRFTFWAMRRVADSTGIIKGQLSLVLVLMLLSAALTHALGLHPLLGAFVFGVLLSRAPRTNRALLDSIQTLASSLFAPVFFVLAGMRVDVLAIGGISALPVIALLFVVATTVKVGLGALGARLGGLSGWESALVGVGLTMKGGTDIIVAIVGVELGLLNARTYTLYAVVVILTVLLAPPVLTWLEKKAPPTAEESERLAREEAERRAYVPRIEHVLVPRVPQLLPGLVAEVVQRIAIAKHEQRQIFDIMELVPEDESVLEPAAEPAVIAAEQSLDQAARLRNVERVEQPVNARHALKPILDVSREYDLIALGAHPQPHRSTVSFGRLQDAVIQRGGTDVLVVASPGERLDAAEIKRILVPTNGQEFSMAAGDIAGYLALANGGEVVLFHVVSSDMDALFWREGDHRRLRRVGYNVTQELDFRLKRLGVPVSGHVVVGSSAGDEIARELQRGEYDLVVLGGYNRSTTGRPYLGGSIRTVLAGSAVPAAVLISRQRT